MAVGQEVRLSLTTRVAAADKTSSHAVAPVAVFLPLGTVYARLLSQRMNVAYKRKIKHVHCKIYEKCFKLSTSTKL